MELSQKKISIDLNIRNAYLKVDQPTEIQVVWKRGISSLLFILLGEKHIKTKTKDVDAVLSVA
jgi:hypothetical protein